MSEPERKSTAYHEAGHAVIGVVLGRIPTSVDIVYDACGNAGHTYFGADLPKDFKRYFNQSPEKRHYLEMRVLIALAGTAAHDFLCSGRAHDEGDNRDERAAMEMIEESRSWDQDHDRYLETLKILVREQVTEHWNRLL
jgi:hypothetical protein